MYNQRILPKNKDIKLHDNQEQKKKYVNSWKVKLSI